jgi:hypothetical protein
VYPIVTNNNNNFKPISMLVKVVTPSVEAFIM